MDALIACSLDSGVLGKLRVWLWVGHVGGINPPARCAVEREKEHVDSGSTERGKPGRTSQEEIALVALL